jgi:VWFA-related protein
VVAGLLKGAALAGALRAQDATFSAGVSVVSVLASVRDKQGKLQTDLGQDDFILTENGVAQTIRYFSRQTDLPLTLGLLVDTSLSQRRVLDDEIGASHRFVARVLREDRDRAFLIHFDHETELLQDFTGARTVLDKALDRVQIAQGPQLVRRGPDGGGGPRRGGSDRFPGPPGGSRRQAGTVLYDAIFLAADELLRHETGRKAIVLLTDGVDQGSKLSLHQAIEAAQRSDLVVYSILFADEGSSAPPVFIGRGGRGGRGGGPMPMPQAIDRADGKKVLQQISKETGGGFFEVTKKLTIDEIYRRIEEELRNQYNIGYTPAKAEDVKYRDISLTTKRKELNVQAREGYYPGK